MNDGRADLFREEALAHQVKAHGRRGDVLRILPGWTRWTYWLLIALFLLGFAYAICGTVPDYAEGSALIFFDKPTFLSAGRTATAKQILVTCRQPVVRNQQLIWLYCPEDSRRYDSIRAPHDGRVADIYIHEDQLLRPDDPVLSLVPKDAGREVIGFLPGHYRAQIERGMRLRLELAGYAYAYQELEIDGVENEVLGPEVIRRRLGPELADTLPLSGPVLLVHAKLQSRTFVSDGCPHEYHHGMQGTARVYTRSEPIILRLLPQLKALFDDGQ